MMPSTATTFTAGTLNARCSSGRFTRRIQTPAHTSMKANSVPMLVISPTMLSGSRPANSDVNTKNSMFDFHGVRYFGCVSEKTFGTRPSWLME
jgi:hypothetical protein